MKQLAVLVFLVFNLYSFSQEILKPLTINPYLKDKTFSTRSTGLDSTFQSFTYNNLELPVRDDFSTNKFVDYNVDYTDVGVTSQLYFQLRNETNTTTLAVSTVLCDSTKSRHDSVFVTSGVGVIETNYFTTVQPTWVNDLFGFPIEGEVKNLYSECYVLVDSIIDGTPKSVQDTVWYTNNPTFTQDSARIFSADLSDANEIWIDDYACHNYRYAIDPMSLGVVTFDGVSNDGYPYQWGAIDAYGNADVLTSKPINLSGKTNVFLSFLYQAKGYGNSPDALDSLVLEVRSNSSPNWLPIWETDGDVEDDVWFSEQISIAQFSLLEDGFQFRFRNKATITGVLDHWHIDYVNLRDNSTEADTIIDDLAIVNPVSSLLTDYTAVPWDHYKNLVNPSAVMKPSEDLKVRNNHTAAKLQTNGGLNVNGTSFSLPVSNINWGLGINVYNFGIGTQPYVFPQTFPGDTMADFDVTVNVATSSTNIYEINDTTRFTQSFRNYYAYDDGSAETAYGFQSFNAKTAVRFVAYEVDTLAGVLMKFIPTNSNVTDKIFLLTIWSDENGKPGEIIYQDDFFQPHYPIYAGQKDSYKYFKFNDNQHIPVPKIFYVGFEQIEDEILYIGMDLNHDNSAQIFYDLGSGWANTSFAGSLIIRPVFSTALDGTLDINPNENNISNEISIYPNPTNGVITVEGSNNNFISITDLSGRLISRQQGNNIDLTYLDGGVYIVSIEDLNNNIIFTEKVIKY